MVAADLKFKRTDRVNWRMDILLLRECGSKVSAAVAVFTLGVLFGPLVSFCLAVENTASQSVQDAPVTRPVQSPSTMLLRGSELPTVVNTYRENVTRFKNDFLGKPFFDVLPFLSAKKSTKAAYRVIFGTGSSLSDLDCTLTSPAEVSKITNWKTGDEIHVAGLVKDVAVGIVILDPCTVSK
jgi:hypothetical protein